MIRKYTKTFEQFMRENYQSISDDMDTFAKDIKSIIKEKKQLSTKAYEMTLLIPYLSNPKFKDLRGADLKNQAVMAAADSALDPKKDTNRLEMVWRYISKNVLSTYNIAKQNGTIKVANEDFKVYVRVDKVNTYIDFDFTFRDADTVLPKGAVLNKPFRMLAGEIVPSAPSERKIIFWWLASKSNTVIKIDPQNIKDLGYELAIAAVNGMNPVLGTYNYTSPNKGEWIPVADITDGTPKLILDKLKVAVKAGLYLDGTDTNMDSLYPNYKLIKDTLAKESIKI